MTSRRSFFDLWPLTRGQKFNVTFMAWCISKHRFLGSRNSNMALFFHFDLLEVIFWPLASDQRSKFEFYFCNIMYYSFELLEVIIRGQSLNITFIAWCISKHRFLDSRNSNMALFFHLTSWRSFFWPLATDHRWKSERLLTFGLWSEVKTSISLL